MKPSDQTEKEDKMYGDGDSETESEKNANPHDEEQEDTDILEVFRDITTLNEKEEEIKMTVAQEEDVSISSEDEFDNEIEDIFNQNSNTDIQTQLKMSKPKLENQFSDDFIDIFTFPQTDNTEEKDDTKDLDESVEDSNDSSDKGRERVYKVNLSEDDINVSICEETNDTNDESDSGDDLFFSSEDVMKQFVDLDDGNKIISEEDDQKISPHYGSAELCDENTLDKCDTEKSRISKDKQSDQHIQVEKHVLKFALSKQRFEYPKLKKSSSKLAIEEEKTKVHKESPPFYIQLHQENEHEKRRVNEELFARLFDYELQQVEEIKSGLSVLSHTLKKSNLLKIEQELFRKRSYSSDDLFCLNRNRGFYRSTSEPSFEKIFESEKESERPSSVVGTGVFESNIRPILKKKASPSLSSHGSQTDITAVQGSSKVVNKPERNITVADQRYTSDPGLAKQAQMLPKRSQSVSFLLPPSEYTISKLLKNR